MINFKCPVCGKLFTLRDERGGREGQCACGAVIQVPAAGTQGQGIPVGMVSPEEHPRAGSALGNVSLDSVNSTGASAGSPGSTTQQAAGAKPERKVDYTSPPKQTIRIKRPPAVNESGEAQALATPIVNSAFQKSPLGNSGSRRPITVTTVAITAGLLMIAAAAVYFLYLSPSGSGHGNRLAEDQALADGYRPCNSSMNFRIEGMTTWFRDGGVIQSGEFKRLLINNREIQVVANKFEDGGFIHTKDFGTILIKPESLAGGIQVYLKPGQEEKIASFVAGTGADAVHHGGAGESARISDESQYKTYSSEGLQLRYPATWSVSTKQIPGMIAGFVSPRETEQDVFLANIAITWTDLSKQPLTLDQYVEWFPVQLKQLFKNIKVDDPVAVTLCGFAGKKIVLHEKEGKGTILVAYVMVSGTYAYNIAYMGFGNQYERDAGVVTDVIASLQINLERIGAALDKTALAQQALKNNTTGAALQRAAAGESGISLDQAIKEGKATVKITGLGGSTGDTIRVSIQRKVREPLRLVLTPGTVFKSVAGNVQNMLGAEIKGEIAGKNTYRPTTEINLSDDNEHAYIVEAYCMDFHKGNPGESNTFVLMPPDDVAVKILQAGKAKGASIRAIQAALWMHRDKVKGNEINKRFPVSDADIAVAQGLLEVKPNLGMRTNAKQDIAAMNTALDMIEIDVGRYPTAGEGLNALVKAPQEMNNWRGPYLRAALPKDPWGHAYLYQFPGQHNPNGFDLSSMGPDGEAGTADDIGNW